PVLRNKKKRISPAALMRSAVMLFYFLAFLLLALKDMNGQSLLLAFVAVSCAFRSRNWLLPAAMYSFPVEKRLVSEEQPFYVYVAIKGDQCGDAELPCTPDYCFTDKLRLFDVHDMGKGFYLKKE
ncbi:MAG: hypothetical protein J6Y13_02555, partial [Treponema sp.]|nr:hypothetical protein [Treponema sp.]